MDEIRTHARAVPLLSSSLSSAPGWDSSDQAGVAATAIISTLLALLTQALDPATRLAAILGLGQSAADRSLG
jgi:hypothetical protein